MITQINRDHDGQRMIEWINVPETGGKIQVNRFGEVRSLLRGSERILKQQTDSKGYKRIRVTIDRKKVTYKVHRLVASAFIDNPDNLPQVNHKDGNKANNHVDNLEWVSNRDNCLHAIRSGLWDSVKAGAEHENEERKKPVIACKGVNILYFDSVSDAERYFNSRHISDVCKGKRPHVKGWRFAYEGEVMAGADATNR